MDPVTVRFGKRVRQLRLANGLTQEQLAKVAGLDTKHIGVIERGVKSSSFAAVARLAKALDVDVHELFVPADDKIGPTNPKTTPPTFHGVPRRQLEDFLQELAVKLRRMQRL